jgi:hypothetical protein
MVIVGGLTMAIVGLGGYNFQLEIYPVLLVHSPCPPCSTVLAPDPILLGLRTKQRLGRNTWH